jgi:hypothetical protein
MVRGIGAERDAIAKVVAVIDELDEDGLGEGFEPEGI